MVEFPIDMKAKYGRCETSNDYFVITRAYIELCIKFILIGILLYILFKVPYDPITTNNITFNIYPILFFVMCISIIYTTITLLLSRMAIWYLNHTRNESKDYELLSEALLDKFRKKEMEDSFKASIVNSYNLVRPADFARFDPEDITPFTIPTIIQYLEDDLSMVKMITQLAIYIIYLWYNLYFFKLDIFGIDTFPILICSVLTIVNSYNIRIFIKRLKSLYPEPSTTQLEA